MQRALQLHQAGRRQEAESLYRQVLGQQPNHAAALHFLGLLLHQTGRSEEGVDSIEQSVTLQPQNADFLNNMGTVMRDLGRVAAAVDFFRGAVDIRPDQLAARDNLGSSLKQLGQFDGAEEIYRGTIGRNPFHVRARIGLAETLQEAGRLDEAIALFRESLSIRPKDAELLYGLGVALMEKGKLAEAADLARQAVAIAPAMAKAWLLLTQVKRQTERDAELAGMEAEHAKAPQDSLARMQLSFGLGKANDDLKDYGRAFDYFAEGNAIRRKGIDYDPVRTRDEFEAMKSAFDKAFFEKHRPSDISDDTPIFVVGMPDKAFAEAGQAYIDMLHARYPGFRHVTDKMPGNFLLVGFLHMMLPKAKIVHCARDAAATCLSIFKVHFRGDSHRYGYDLGELADFHNLYTDIMAHWHKVLPGVVHDVRYEDFVADQEGQTRALMAHLGLPWDDKVLAFHETDRPVRTASAAQVRQPMYQGSVDLWKRYGERLKPLLVKLQNG
ncbi:tetratricopeptide repeat-containing sulfotransferase family protein [Mesorhizobium sp. M1A.F.Ca.IN.020.03.1.1]|uniref:tetratricopeptide repeat-containing sulfotransferase family protein n=1 Tax=Mesorhizobium sp. M1A.F.Ca.IN.020.03.1.1 TaxID=2496764 RepID=UPI000FCBAFDB|nr:tetratricopeptide repeat-containing sulfotransferase family protein [Mesorhizobium sp. M1A.F.Ca.IN.020.03.1.1]RUW11815.1 sulfotransferase family protein [Mesorhizobium sp. M1A.F.Ca.IN.020.03.1.1]